MEQQPLVIQQKKTNPIFFVLLGLLLAFSLYLLYRLNSKAKEVETIQTKYKQRGDSLQAVREEANILMYSNDSLSTLLKEDSVRTVYVNRNVYVNTQTNKNTAALYSSPTDSAKIMLWTRLLVDTTFTKGSGATTRSK